MIQNWKCLVIGSLVVALGRNTAVGQEVLFHVEGPNWANDNLGYAVAGVGDVNHDGIPDFAASSPKAAQGSSNLCPFVRVFSGADGSLLHELLPQGSFYYCPESVSPGLTVSPFSQFGIGLAGAGDINGDGYDDILVGSPFSEGGFPMPMGRVQIFSGKDKAVLLELTESAPTAFGWAVAGGKDINGDGHPDFLVGAPDDDSTGSNAGRVKVCSGKDGAIFRDHYGNPGANLGRSVAILGDLNADGMADYAIGAPNDGTIAQGAGETAVFSGKDGSLLFSVFGDTSWDACGLAVSGADVDNNGVPDLVVSYYVGGCTIFDTFSGMVRVFSGVDGSQLREFKGPKCSNMGKSLAGLGDVNGDGHDDVLAGAPSFTQDSVWVFSGKDGTVLHSIIGPSKTGLPAWEAQYLFLGQSVGAVGDLDQDGLDDFLVGKSGIGFFSSPPYSTVSYVEVFKGCGNGSNCEGATGTPVVPPLCESVLNANSTEASVFFGGAQILSLNSDPVCAGNYYFVIGTTNGVSPGLDIGSVHIPIQFNWYSTFTLTNPGMGFQGVLDPGGNGAAQFTLPTGLSPDLVGLTVNHAYVVISAKDYQVLSASNPVSCTLLP